MIEGWQGWREGGNSAVTHSSRRGGAPTTHKKMPMHNLQRSRVHSLWEVYRRYKSTSSSLTSAVTHARGGGARFVLRGAE